MSDELRIRIARRPNGGFEVDATGPGGEGSGSFSLPFDEKDLRILILEMGVPRGLSRGVQSPASEAARTLGGGLFDALFQGEVGELFVRSRALAEAAGSPLRLTLTLSDSADLMHLPWEYLYDSDRGLFLATSRRTPVVRYVEIPSQRRPMLVEPPLRILAMVSSPSDADRLDVDGERRKLERAVDESAAAGLVSITWLPAATFEALQDELRNPGYHVFHFIGHGGFDPVEDESVLLLEAEDGRSLHVTGEQLGALLFDHTSLRLAVLNACEAARASLRDPFAGVATSLVRREVPAVIAMQFPITDTAAIRFSSELYAAIADGLPVDAALGEARKGMYAADPKSVEWGTPVLFMRVADGRIFDVDRSAIPAREEAAGQIDAEPGHGDSEGEPPLPAVREPTVSRGRGRLRRHRAALTGIGALVAVAVVLVVILSRHDGPGPGPQPTGTSQEVDPSEPPSTALAQPPEPAASIASTLVPLDPAGGAGALSAAWTPEGLVVYVLARDFRHRPLLGRPAEGGEQQKVFDGLEGRHDFPSYDKDGNVVFQSNIGGDGFNIYVLHAGDSEPQLVAGATGERIDQVTPSWVPGTGEIVYARGAPPPSETTFDLEIAGGPGDATALAIPDRVTSDELFPAISPDGTELAFVRFPHQSGCQRGELWLADFDAATRSVSNARAVVTSANDVRRPSWAPDSRRLVFSAQFGDRYGLYVLDLSQASSEPRPVDLGADAPLDAIDPAWAPTGDRVAFTGGPFVCRYAKYAPLQGYLDDFSPDTVEKNTSSRIYLATLAG